MLIIFKKKEMIFYFLTEMLFILLHNMKVTIKVIQDHEFYM